MDDKPLWAALRVHTLLLGAAPHGHRWWLPGWAVQWLFPLLRSRRADTVLGRGGHAFREGGARDATLP